MPSSFPLGLVVSLGHFNSRFGVSSPGFATYVLVTNAAQLRRTDDPLSVLGSRFWKQKVSLPQSPVSRRRSTPELFRPVDKGALPSRPEHLLHSCVDLASAASREPPGPVGNQGQGDCQVRFRCAQSSGTRSGSAPRARRGRPRPPPPAAPCRSPARPASRARCRGFLGLAPSRAGRARGSLLQPAR